MSIHPLTAIIKFVCLSWLTLFATLANAESSDDLAHTQLEEARSLSNTDIDKAFELTGSVIKLAKEAKNQNLLVEAYTLAATLRKSQGAHFEALSFIDQARDALVNKGEVTRLALEIELEHALILERIGDFKGAADLLLPVVEKAAAIKSYITLLEAQNFLGIIYDQLGKKKLALEQYLSLIKNLERYDKKELIGPVYNNIAAVHYGTENNVEALRYLKLANSAKTEKDSPARQQLYLTNLAKILIALDQLDNAKSAIDEAKALSDVVDLDYSKNLLLHAEADWYLNSGDLAKAEELLLESLAVSKQQEQYDIIMASFASLVALKQKQHDYQAALAYLKEMHQRYVESHEQSNVNLLLNMEQVFSEAAQQHRLLLLEKEKNLAKLRVFGIIFVLVITLVTLYLLKKQVQYRKDEAELTERYNQYLEDSNISDGLTGLLNRIGMVRAWQSVLKSADNEKKELAFAVIGINGFKTELQSKGKEIVDQVIKHVAHFVKKGTQKPNAAARWFDDQFVIMFAPGNDVDIRSNLEYLQENIKKHPLIVDDSPLELQLSVGVAEGESDPYQILERANYAQFEASKKGQLCVFMQDNE